MSAPEELLRRYLEQRAELGEHELILDRFAPGDLGTLLNPVPVMPEREAAAVASADAPPAPPPSSLEVSQTGSLEALNAQAQVCTSCALCEGRKSVVFGEGNPQAQVLVVGEAPGAEEDRTGRPFVGRAGKLLDLLLRSVGFAREDVYICNVLKCRPPGNRDPQPEEVEACSPLLRRQVELVQPRVIVAFGSFAAQTLLGRSGSIGRLRGEVHDYQGVPLVPTYHPAALLRNPSWIRPVWEDLQRLRKVVDAG